MAGPGGPGGFPGGAGGFPGGGQEQPEDKPAEEAKNTRILVELNDTSVLFRLDLVLDGRAFNRLVRGVELLLMNLNAEMETAAHGVPRLHALAQAGKQLGERGIPEKGIPPGHFPPGALVRKSGNRVAREPGNRISWMAGLLPMLGHDSLYRKIDYNARWNEPANWLAARTLVPEFIDPAYPLGARFTHDPRVPLDVAVTHFVGLSGIGVDSADPEFRADPANVLKLGIFGYDQPMPLKALERGASNTALMVQIPHDGLAPPGSWLAGGGSTVRGVPDKGSVKPFVSTQHKSQRGTMLLMADGSVRFVNKDVSDAAFKALILVRGGTPEDFDLDNVAPRVPLSKEKAEKPAPAPAEAAPGAPVQPADPNAPTPPAAKPESPAEKPEAQEKPPAEKPAAQEKPQSKSALPKGWKEFSAPEDGFAVAVPGTMEKKDIPGAGGKGKMNLYLLVDPSGGTSFTAMAIHLPPGEAQMPDEKKWTDFRAGMMGQIKGGTLKAERKVSLGDHPGREYEIEVPSLGVTSIARAYDLGDRVYSLSVAGRGLTANSDAVRNFFNSFRLLSK
jgi:hypothetical protein